MSVGIEVITIRTPQELSMTSCPGGQPASALVEELNDAAIACVDMRASLSFLTAWTLSPANYESAALRAPDVKMVEDFALAVAVLERLLGDARDRLCKV